ncbi:LPS translocon maturation chaperone LptM [Marinobacter nauticus]|uniref:LPS translocon maturation chaperone LptM n=1 Tax=Marinobacter nauticus TaxID=2743 RepID=UPI00242D1F38|nr:lipoprotein [Marinobacter nauticus]
MQLGLVRRLAVVLSVFVVLMVSGCGQKGPLYRNAPVPDALPSQTGDTEAAENADEDKPDHSRP